MDEISCYLAAKACQLRVKINHTARVDLLVAYSNRPDLRERLQRAAMILLEEPRRDDEPDS
jgi:hypothetical protein